MLTEDQTEVIEFLARASAKKTPTNCGFACAAAVCANAVPAGNIASSIGKASVTPDACRKVRRAMCFFVMNDMVSVLWRMLRGAMVVPDSLGPGVLVQYLWRANAGPYPQRPIVEAISAALRLLL